MSSDNPFKLVNEEIEAKLLLEKANLMISIRDKLEDLGLTQSVAASIMGVTQPRVSNLCKGQVSRFSLDMLFIMNERIKAHGELIK